MKQKEETQSSSQEKGLWDQAMEFIEKGYRFDTVGKIDPSKQNPEFMKVVEEAKARMRKK